MSFRPSSFISRLVPLIALSALIPALAPAQKVVVWGKNESGQYKVPTDRGPFSAISSTAYHCLGIGPDGTVAEWGDHEGNNEVPDLKGVLQAYAGQFASLAILEDGSLRGWGTDTFGNLKEIPDLKGVRQVSGGEGSFIALLDDGTVRAWGGNGVAAKIVPDGLNDIVQVAAGGDKFLALHKDGTVIEWSKDPKAGALVPEGLKGVTEIAQGYDHTVALLDDGTVVAWGDTNLGQCDVPKDLKDVVAVAAGGSASTALKRDGTVVAWGYKDLGQCDVPKELTGGVLAVQTGFTHCLALQASAWATLDQSEVYGGDAATGTVHLAEPAKGDVKVALKCTDPRVQVPDSVVVKEGETEAAFPVTTDAGSPDFTATIQTDSDGKATVPVTIKVKGFSVAFTCNRTAFVPGSVEKVSVTLTLTGPLSTDATFDLAASEGLKVQGAVTIKAGEWSVSVPVEHNRSVPAGTATITATYLKHTIDPINLRVVPITATLTFLPSPVYPGGTTVGTVTINEYFPDPVEVSLSCDNPDVTLPSSLSLDPGQKTAQMKVSVGTGIVFKENFVPVQATIGKEDFYGNLRIYPPAVISTIKLPASVRGGGAGKGTVKLTRTAGPGGLWVQLGSSDPDSMSVPPDVYVPEGKKSATFEVVAADVDAEKTIEIAAADGRTKTKTTCQVVPASISLSLSASKVRKGGMVNGNVTVNSGSALRVDIHVLVSVTGGDVGVPKEVVIKAGESKATFDIVVGGDGAPRTVLISVTKGKKTVSKSLKITL
ncbi:hypothetical protein BH11ARM2_BH11ARM2_27500 [soil metagenome]